MKRPYHDSKGCKVQEISHILKVDFSPIDKDNT